MGYLESKREKQVQNALASMRIVTDLLISVSVGTSGTLFMLEAEKNSMRQDFENSPLVSGRSVVADEMCSGMISIANEHQIPPGLSSNDPTMATFQTFVSNCRRRVEVEEKLRLQRGKAEDEPIVVPLFGLSNKTENQR
jgi:hypothetical protein